jgi:hypothetical protein
MKKKLNVFVRTAASAGLTALFLSVPGTTVLAQSFTIGATEIQAHGFVQQGFNATDENNFLTMKTTDGSGAMTDGGFNLASNLTRKLRVGAQLYARNIGDLGNGSLEVDWAFADYRFADGFGIRAGKMKTMLGLFTDTQDMEFLYTWALLPQGTYPLDLRSITIAHVGADAYGTVRLGKAGSLGYTGYYGVIQDDDQGGYRYGVEDNGLSFRSAVQSRGGGIDLRWTTPIDGLMTGYSFSQNHLVGQLLLNAYQLPFTVTTEPQRRQAVYADYQWSRLRLSGESRHEYSARSMSPAAFPTSETPSRSWFAAASYRLFDKLEVGSYHSNYVYDLNLPSSNADNHIYDTAISSRVDVTRFWNIKVEGHFVDGTGSTAVAHGFYRRTNSGGFDRKTRMLVIRTGVNF